MYKANQDEDVELILEESIYERMNKIPECWRRRSHCLVLYFLLSHSFLLHTLLIFHVYGPFIQLFLKNIDSEATMLL